MSDVATEAGFLLVVARHSFGTPLEVSAQVLGGRPWNHDTRDWARGGGRLRQNKHGSGCSPGSRYQRSLPLGCMPGLGTCQVANCSALGRYLQPMVGLARISAPCRSDLGCRDQPLRNRGPLRTFRGRSKVRPVSRRSREGREGRSGASGRLPALAPEPWGSALKTQLSDRANGAGASPCRGSQRRPAAGHTGRVLAQRRAASGRQGADLQLPAVLSRKVVHHMLRQLRLGTGGVSPSAHICSEVQRTRSAAK